jgi:integrase
MARPKGQRGTVERHRGKWRYRFYEDAPDGKRIRRAKGGFATETAARRALRKVLTEIDEGTYVAPSSETVGTYLATWLEAQRPHVEPNTWMTYSYHVTYYLAPDEAARAAYQARTRSERHPDGLEKPNLANVCLQDLDEQRVSRHLGDLLTRGKRDGRGLSPRTVKGVRITLNAALAGAYPRLLPRPVQVKRIAVGKRPPTIYTPVQIKTFLQVAFQDRLVALWALAVTSALRPSELLGLAWDAVDLEDGTIAIWQKQIKVGTRAMLADGTKTEDSAALIALAPWVIDLLRGWRKQQAEERQLWPGPIEDHKLVFTKPNGAPLKPDWANRRFQKLAGQADLPRIRLYDLRHGWATAALRAGLHPRLVQEVMRHSHYRTTAETYTHVMPTQSAETVRAVAALFQPLCSTEAEPET